jgi:hypothetical protein
VPLLLFSGRDPSPGLASVLQLRLVPACTLRLCCTIPYALLPTIHN